MLTGSTAAEVDVWNFSVTELTMAMPDDISTPAGQCPGETDIEASQPDSQPDPEGGKTDVRITQGILAQFLHTKRWSDDLASEIPGGNWQNCKGGGTAKGFVYAGQLYIERMQSWWPKSAHDRGDWCLTIGNAEYITDDLAALESRLCDFAVAEGFSP